MRTTLKAEALERRLPLCRIQDDVLWSPSADMTVGFRLFPHEALTLSGEDLDSLHDGLVTALGMLPSWCIVHKMDVFYRDKVKMDREKDRDFLERASSGYFEGRKVLRQDSYLFLTRSSKEKMQKGYIKRSLFTPFMSVLPVGTGREESERFLSLCLQISETLRKCGIANMRLTRKDYLGSDTQGGLLEDLLGLHLDRTREDLSGGVLEDLYLEGDRVGVGDRALTVYSLRDSSHLPLELTNQASCAFFNRESGLSYPVSRVFPLGLGLDVPHIVNLYLFLDDSAENLRNLERQMHFRMALSRYSMENRSTEGFIRTYLEKGVQGQKRSIRAHLNVMLYHDGALEDRNLSKRPETLRLVDALTDLGGLVCHRESLSAAPLFVSMLPGCASELSRKDTFLSFMDEALCLMLLEGEAPQGPPSGASIRFTDRLQGRVLNVDLTEEPMRLGLIGNRNKFVLGPSGSGKSFLMNHMMAAAYRSGAHVLIVDTGGSYKALAEIIFKESGGVDGAYLEDDADQGFCCNPFLGLTEDRDAERRERLGALVRLLWKKPEEVSTRLQEQMIDASLEQYGEYALKTPLFAPSMNGYYAFLRDQFGLYLKEKGISKQDFDLQGLLLSLMPYSEGGSYEHLLNKTQGPSLGKSRFTVFEIDRVKDHPVLFPLTVAVIMDLYLEKMRCAQGQKKIILLEEAWKAIASTQMAPWVKYLFKTVRKYYGEAILVTQDLEDILSSEVVQNAVINNADCRMLLDMRRLGNRLEDVKRMLGLSDMDLRMLESLNRIPHKDRPLREVLVSLGSKARVLALEVSQEERLAYTTSPEERPRLDALSREMHSRIKAIERYLTEEKERVI